MKYYLFAISFCSLFLQSCLNGNCTPISKGTIVDESSLQPIEGVKITITATGNTESPIYSDEFGYFEFSFPVY